MPCSMERRIEHARARVQKAKEEYENQKALLLELEEELEDQKRDAVFAAMKKSSRTYEEILSFIKEA